MTRLYNPDDIRNVALKFLEDEIFLDKFMARFEDTISRSRIQSLKAERRRTIRKYWRIIRYLKKMGQVQWLKWLDELSDFSGYDEIRERTKTQLDQTYLRKHLDSSIERSQFAIKNRVRSENRELAIEIFRDYPYSQAENIIEAGLQQNWSMNVLLGDARVLLLAYEEAIDRLAMFTLIESKRSIAPPDDQGPT